MDQKVELLEAPRSHAERWLNGLAFVLVIVVNTLANALPIGGQTTGEVSARYPSLFTPAGYVFSIWGFIYLLLLGFVVYQALPAQSRSAQLHAVHKPFVLSCLANASWIFAWHYNQIWLSFLLMLVLLASLVLIYLRNQRHALGQSENRRRSLGVYICLMLPFSVYTAWICVATLANFSALQLVVGWQHWPFHETAQVVVKIALAASIAVAVLYKLKDLAFVAVVVWACVGIALAPSQAALVAGAAWAAVGVGIMSCCNPWLYAPTPLSQNV